MNFDTQNICLILGDEKMTSHIIVNTPRSPYNGKKYEVMSTRRYNHIWNVRVRRGNSNCYYDWNAVRLADSTIAKFNKLINRQYDIRDVLNKQIHRNDLLHNDGMLFKVEFVTKKHIYVTDTSNEYRFNKYMYEVANSLGNSLGDGDSYYKIDAVDSKYFLVVDNPLDILRIE